jgi:hypothetical protein
METVHSEAEWWLAAYLATQEGARYDCGLVHVARLRCRTTGDLCCAGLEAALGSTFAEGVCGGKHASSGLAPLRRRVARAVRRAARSVVWRSRLQRMLDRCVRACVLALAQPYRLKPWLARACAINSRVPVVWAVRGHRRRCASAETTRAPAPTLASKLYVPRRGAAPARHARISSQKTTSKRNCGTV